VLWRSLSCSRYKRLEGTAADPKDGTVAPNGTAVRCGADGTSVRGGAALDGATPAGMAVLDGAGTGGVVAIGRLLPLVGLGIAIEREKEVTPVVRHIGVVHLRVP
jgi:hypothetical protein